MRPLTKTYFLLWLVFLGCCFAGCQPTADKQKKQQASQTDEAQNRKQNQIPLLVVGRFDADTTIASVDALRKAYCSGQVYVWQPIKARVDKQFGCTCQSVVNTLQAFQPLAKKNLLVTTLDGLDMRFRTVKIGQIDFFENPQAYPLWMASSEDFDASRDLSTFILTGVTAITRATGNTADARGAMYLVEKVKPYFQQADWVHISNEVSFKPNCVFEATTRFCSKEDHFEVFKALRANIIELTGNHNRDFGDKYYLETLTWYQTNKMQTFGGGKDPEAAQTPLLITLRDGKKVAFVGFNEKCPLAECAKKPNEPGANPYDATRAKQIIEKLRQQDKVAFIIVSVQFGESDAYSPTASQEKICKNLVEFGADLVYGSQAHQVQQVEFYKGKVILYGLGNFIFDQTHKVGVRQGYFLQNYFYKGKIVQSVPVYTFIDDTHRPDIATAAQAQAIRKAIYLDRLLFHTQ
ncbi:MAG TPA: hypothetical protein DCM08_04930 [Microscillaceae bacterium]|jgi:hypothetical protein|nr:hypothetical protein [Microscillaceae bacterium]